MISVDRVYQTVQKILNKEQRGYFPPIEFNLFATNAQIEIFENYFFELGRATATYGMRDTMYENIPDNIFEKLEPFTVAATIGLTAGAGELPDDLYRLETILSRNIPVEFKLHEEIGILQRSPLTMATVASPYYTRVDNDITVYPATLTNAVIHYIKNLTTAPQWAYMNVGGRPVYNAAGSTNFELHSSEEPELVAKIASYAGVAVRAGDVMQFAQAKDNQITQSEQ